MSLLERLSLAAWDDLHLFRLYGVSLQYKYKYIYVYIYIYIYSFIHSFVYILYLSLSLSLAISLALSLSIDFHSSSLPIRPFSALWFFPLLSTSISISRCLLCLFLSALCLSLSLYIPLCRVLSVTKRIQPVLLQPQATRVFKSYPDFEIIFLRKIVKGWCLTARINVSQANNYIVTTILKPIPLTSPLLLGGNTACHVFASNPTHAK